MENNLFENLKYDFYQKHLYKAKRKNRSFVVNRNLNAFYENINEIEKENDCKQYIILGTCFDWRSHTFLLVDKNCKQTGNTKLYELSSDLLKLPDIKSLKEEIDCNTDYFGKTLNVEFNTKFQNDYASCDLPSCKLVENEDCFTRGRNLLNVLSALNKEPNKNSEMLELLTNGTYALLRREISGDCEKIAGFRYVKIHYPIMSHGKYYTDCIPCKNKKLEMDLYKDTLKMPLVDFINKWEVYKGVYVKKFQEKLEISKQKEEKLKEERERKKQVEQMHKQRKREKQLNAKLQK